MENRTDILVPIDFSSCSESALAFALQLAGRIKSHLIILNVPTFDRRKLENPLSASSVIEEENEKIELRIANSIQKVKNSIVESSNESPSIQTIIEMGKIVPTICDVAERHKADYIIMGTQGENSTLDKYLGSVSSNVLKNAPCSVFVIPQTTMLTKETTLAYATDFSDADPFEIWKAMKFLKPFQPQIKCVHLNEKQENVEGKIKELQSFFADTTSGLKIEFLNLPAGDMVKDMNDFLESEKINMLVMYMPKRNFFESLFRNSYTQKMAKHTKIPLLVIKENK